MIFSAFKKAFLFCFLAFILSSISVSVPAAYATVANKLGNAGFELALGGSGNWDNTVNRGITTVSTGAPAGTTFLRLAESGATTVSGSFTFQTVSPAAAGDFVSFSALVRASYDDGDDQGQLRIEFQNGGGGLISGTNTAITASTTFSRAVVSGTAPAGTKQVVFVMRIQNIETTGLGASTVDFDDTEGTINGNPILLEANAANNVVQSGNLNTVAVRVENQSAETLVGLEVVANPADGLTIHRSVDSFDGVNVPQREGSVIFELGNLAPGQNSVLAFFVTLTSGIIPGKSYELTLLARSTTSGNSGTIRILFRADLDPVFDEGTIIGRVFHDENQNGVLDRGEKGVPRARLVTEEGIQIITDQHGKYHLPAVKPGRHVIKIDAHSLPKGTKFITEESYLTKTTNGLLNKVNFAVLLPPSKVPEEFSEGLSVLVTQGMDASRPTLDVTMEPEILKTGLDILEKDPVFRFQINYADFVKTWYLEIRDSIGTEIWTGFGVGAPPAEVLWSGHTETGVLVKPGLYSYQFKIQDKDRQEDWTVMKFFRVFSKTDPKYQENAVLEIPPVGNFNLFYDGKQSVPLIAKPTIRIQGTTQPRNRVTVNTYPVNVDSQTGFFETEIYTSPGEKEIVVTSTGPDGESTTYRETVEVKDSTFFMVALAEEQIGVNFQGGSVQTIAEDDRFKDGFYEDGRLSFYLKGKLKGKFLIQSHYDTDEKRSALFTNLDPDKYYPVYGDASERDYESQDTLSRFFFVIEMDRSFAKWGSFKTEFLDTELATYNRTLNGAKIHYETVGSTQYGDPNRGFTLFWSEARHRGDHNEFAATGGTLYYLRNRGVIEGSEKIRVEIRDKIQDIAVDSYDLVEGRDYEIDYDEGRILLTKPLSSVAPSDTLVTISPLDGNPRFLIVDYEFDAGANAFVNSNRGMRGFTQLGDHVKMGATAVQEKRGFQQYDLRGVDATFKAGRNTKVTMEYAETQREQVEQAVSFNGGLSFANLEPVRGNNTRPRENAYLIKAESKPVKNVDVSGFIQSVEPGFSTDRIRSQEGFKKWGLSAKYTFNDYSFLRYRYDRSQIADQLKPLDEHGVSAPFEDYTAHTVQAVYNDGKWLGDLEYRRQQTELPPANLSPTLLSEVPFENGIAGKFGYYLNERLLPYIRFQVTTDGKDDNLFGGGVRYDVTKDIFTYVEHMLGSIGDSVLFGFGQSHENGGTSYANFRMLDRGVGNKTLSTSIGNSFPLSDRSRVYSEREYSSYEGVDGFADIMGYEGALSNRWRLGATFERRHLQGAVSRRLTNQAGRSILGTNTANAVTGTLSYDDQKKLKARTHLEVRYDQDDPELWQWVTRNYVEYQVNEDLSFLGKLDFGKSRFLDPEDTPADFMEFDVGLAYRPLKFDKLNILARYSFLRNMGNDLQFTSNVFNGVETDEEAHLLAIDLAYDLHRYLSVVEKVAYKNSILNTSITDEVILHTFLWANRFNFHVTRKWDLALEYRLLFQSDAAKTFKHGTLVEVDREFYDYVRLGLGYNFTDFDDDLRKANNFDSQGPFVRLTGKF